MSQPNPILQLKKNPGSRLLAIKAMCAQCFGCTENHLEEGFRQSIRECSSTHCALYELRPFTNRKNALKKVNCRDKSKLIARERVDGEQAKKTPQVAKI
jgi:hypothetical protein